MKQGRIGSAGADFIHGGSGPTRWATSMEMEAGAAAVPFAAGPVLLGGRLIS